MHVNVILCTLLERQHYGGALESSALDYRFASVETGV